MTKATRADARTHAAGSSPGLPDWARAAEARIRDRDRRREDRSPLAGEGIAVFSDADGGAKIVRVDFADASAAGIGVLSGLAITPGATFTLRPESGLSHAHSGVVSRCTREGDRYRLGLKLARSVAA
ncbi:MAG: hypothetical protein AABZ53_07995 [Planctomycetota bacterium]